jgi:hypothetical protein
MAASNRAPTGDSGKVPAQPADDGRSQIDKFREAARELETDDDEAAFDERLKKLATPKPKAPDKAK